jgi:tetratricopeptide (TPR) repeat protein
MVCATCTNAVRRVTPLMQAIPAPALLCALVLVVGCGGKIADHPSLAVTKFLPATLEADRTGKGGEPRTAKVRIYADPGVRALPQWKEEIADQLDYASQLLHPLIGVKLAVESYQDWARAADPQDALRELIQLDKAEGVTWVIGYVSPPDAASKVMTNLGGAHPLGRHVTVRAWAEKPELDVLAGKLPDLKDAQRGEVVAAHRRHKQTVVLLHMLATTLGAIDEANPEWIQHPQYSPAQHSFATRTRDLLQLAIDSRLAGDSDQVLAKKLGDAIDKDPWAGWIPSSREQLVTALNNVLDAAKAGKTFADVPAAAYEQYKRISELAKQGKTADALVELDNLMTGYPGNATMLQLKCEIMLRKPGVADNSTRAVCSRVSELAPGDPTVHIAVGEALIRAGDPKAARGELVRAEDKIGNLPTGAADRWRKLIDLYIDLGALTWTEDAIAKAKLGDDPAVVRVAQTRARYGIPRGAKFVTAEAESKLVAAIRAALDLIYASKFAEAERALAAADKSWPGAPGLVATRCDLAFRKGQFDAARAACTRALAGDPNDSWALYLYGVLLLRDAGTTNAGIEKLKRVIEIDPELAQAWRSLGKAYTRGRDRAAFEQLSRTYQEKFGQPLPP